ncbi:hypothetical protein BZG02_06780 [Labilibaculum filiforme]|uniref:Uncharacterized protein n=1 Tax=Labilibaculum filiforme TaxID=1940526 RepID=A0A2N3I2H7_9BACT|nr:hypothetical protein [Labilibaculum filiforme]PKQ64506.1 hypothetical protein BZG02_06780 [Labilibaculum filiforme]
MSKKIKIIIALFCLVAGLVYQFYYQGEIVLIDEETTDFLSGILVGAGASILIVSIFNPKKKRL